MTKPKKMIVLSHGRTGSTYLIKALNRHPDFDMKRELFFSNPDMRPDVNGEVWEKGTDSWGFLDRTLFGPRNDAKSIAGFKLFYFHARGGEAEQSIWRRLETDPSLRLITLHRDNIFAGYVSLKRAEKTRLWHPGKDPANYQKTVHLTLDAKAAHRHIVAYKAYQDQGRDIVKDKAHLAVTYEDFQADAQDTLSRIVDFAGGQEQQVDWPLFKGGSASNESTVIDNLDEVAQELALLGIEWMLAPFRPATPQS